MISQFNPFSLAGKTVVVTGASSGIGRQCAIDCSRMGARVVAMGRNRQRLDETLDALAPGVHKVVEAELTDFDSLPRVAADIVRACGKIDGLVNCAGTSTTLPLKLMDADKLDEYFRANVYSAIELTRELSKVKSMNTGGSIVFLSSVMGLVGDKGKSLYSATKGALVSAARSLACEFAKREIRVNCISPGAILTPINAKLPHMADPELRAALEEKHLLGLGRPDDISGGCIFLLSDASRWMTGQNLVIDGGFTAR